MSKKDSLSAGMQSGLKTKQLPCGNWQKKDDNTLPQKNRSHTDR